ncbi:sec-independent protein translocase protein TatB-like [Salvia splendens]|uniref:sec-independent protein translocase protein TatB-like n=1 Tax=Salvia splendens TaxID=180675 RepID=UPI001C25AB15|nr:sec-independent protein translocase protein TatB-like [Salvia splendens]XP_042008107.1 sec-independent protein translocase protein TatB-like [Salvia splendens]XP_042008108.1 sec-independent protein translocase protein TatB-like [Salvia splendens]XP_042008109.1 sec-independent protein translocase protein TatB-like [Salvia splendens]XP_042008110.1 sec-independent protein translocase protein TatB-like [Salvia splendens]XP_042008111.1 sec-independent protein translocase protein TatB-like [Salvi
MLGISYGELFLIVGAAAALIGPKDLPVIARTAGRLAGRAIGYVQVARGQFESVMHQSQARQVHKELQDTMAQLEAIRHEVRSISFMNPGPLTTRLVDNIASQPPVTNVEKEFSKPPQDSNVRVETPVSSSTTKDHSPSTSSLSDVHSQASAYARLAESAHLTANSMDDVLNELKDDSGQFVVLPISAETAKLLPCQKGDLSGSDLLLEAVLEEEVARNAKSFFSQAQIQTKSE